MLLDSSRSTVNSSRLDLGLNTELDKCCSQCRCLPPFLSTLLFATTFVSDISSTYETYRSLADGAKTCTPRIGVGHGARGSGKKTVSPLKHLLQKQDAKRRTALYVACSAGGPKVP